MSFTSLLIHTIVHVHPAFDDRVASRSAYGQPTQSLTRTTVKGLVQPKDGREQEDTRDAGAALSDHVIFLAPMNLDGADWFEYGGDRYDIVASRRYDFGRSPHVEVDAHRVVNPAPALVDEAGS